MPCKKALPGRVEGAIPALRVDAPTPRALLLGPALREGFARRHGSHDSFSAPMDSDSRSSALSNARRRAPRVAVA